MATLTRNDGNPVLQNFYGRDMHPVDRFTLFATAIGELLAEHAGRISDADLDELAELIAQFVFDRERNRGEADMQKLDQWLSRFAVRLSARHLRETECN